MSILLMEGFGWMETGAVDFYGLYSSSGGTIYDDPGSGRKSFRASGLPNNTNMGLSASVDTLYMGFRLRIGSTGGRNLNLMGFQDNGVGLLNLLWAANDNYLRVYRFAADNAGYLMAITTNPIPNNTWVHINIEVYFHNTAGYYKLWINGNLEIDFSGDTIYQGTECDVIRWGVSETANNWDMEVADIWVDDATNHGDAYITYEPCDQAGSSADWTPNGAGTNQACVDEVGPNDDTDYISSDTSTDLDQLGSSNVADLSGGAIAVQAHAVAAAPGGGTPQLKLGIKSGASHGQGSAQGIGGSYLAYRELFEDVPGGSGWTQSQVQGCEVSVENV